ncbi:MAG: S-methyl-5-thioribose-1-phosphate isomerase [Chloroflexi bacterium]|nr:S-methyl-5-thioribose-1-phosphate isomerase [Chloroflexota bacterium]
MSIEPLAWEAGHLRLLDQTKLPNDEVWLELTDHKQVAEAINSMRVRGAPAIGVAGAFGLALAAVANDASDYETFLRDLRTAAEELIATRPTGANLGWAVKRTLAAAEDANDIESARTSVLREAKAIQREDIEGNRALGRHALELVPERATFLTHCNAGALATAGYGTALGIVRAAADAGKHVNVIATETRPLSQGARLTAWELLRDGIKCTLIVDGAVGSLLKQGETDLVVVGADRIVANGDTANKIGTYNIAVLAREHGVPFYVAAPTSTIDMSISGGDGIVIEERDAEEVTAPGGRRIAPPDVEVSNPAFDVTPHELIAAIITERGIARPPYVSSLSEMMR